MRIKGSNKIKLTAATIAITGIMCLSANAGQWKSNDRGWWYDNGNGTWPANAWQWIDGNNDGTAECYYFDRFGYCVIGSTTQDGYTTNENGAWTVNRTIQTKTVGTNSTANQTTIYKEAEEAYKNYLRTAKNEMSLPLRYELVYLDNDDVPELMYTNGESHNCTVSICAYKNGKVVPVVNSENDNSYGQFGSLTFYPRTGYVKSVYTGSGIESETWYSMQGTTMTEIASIFTNNTNSSDDEFTINGTKTTRENVENYVQQLVSGVTGSLIEYSRATTLQ